MQSKQLEITVHIVEGQARNSLGPCRIEGIVEDVVNSFQRLPIPVDGERFITTEAIGPDIIKSVQVIGMGMGKQYRVQATNIIAQSLNPQIG